MVDEATSRNVVGYGTVVLVGLSSITFVLEVVLPILSGKPITEVTEAVLLALLAVLVILTFGTPPGRARLARFVASRKSPAILEIPGDFVSDVFSLAERVHLVWSSESDKVFSLNIPCMMILNVLAGLPAERQIYREQAYGVILGWKDQHPVEEALFSEIGGLVELGETINQSAFLILLDHVHQFALAGAKTSNTFVQSASNALGPSYLRDQWGEHREKANRLSEDIQTLGLKVNRRFAFEKNWFIPSVNDLRIGA